MNKYFVLHTIKTSVEELEMAMEGAPELARSMAAGETPAKCLKTWDPTPHGRTDYVFCLWEADGSPVHCDAGPESRYGHYDATFFPDGRALQVRGGELILRDHTGAVTGHALGARGADRPGMPIGLLGGVQAVSATDTELVVIHATADQATRLRPTD